MSESAQALLASWSFPFWTFLALLLTGLIYTRGWRLLRQTRPSLFPPGRLVSFLAGLLSLWIAVASPLDALGNLLLLAHMAQHLVLMSIAPPLLLLGAPLVPLLRGLPRPFVREALGPFLSLRWLQSAGRFLTRPRFAWIVFNLAYVGWHVPASYELALHSSAWHETEHACFFLTSLLFWWPVIQPWPARPRGSRWIVLPYLISADIVNTGLSAFLCFCSRVLYPTYQAAPRILALSALQDQVAAGGFMWVIGSMAFLIPAAILTMRLLSPIRILPLEPHPIRIKSPAPFDLLRLPLVGPLLRARYGRPALQALLLLVAIAIIIDGFLGHPMGAMNLAGVLPWTYARAFAVLALLIAGNFFCMVCPFTLPREIGHRLGLATHHWPRWLRSKWLAVGLLVVFFWSYEVFALWDHPARTAWILIAYFAGAFLVDTFFRGASFCKYVCPIGQFNFVSSLISPLELKARSLAVCNSCTTHDCIRGNQRQRGCELQLFVPAKAGNLDCTLCMDCVKACPTDNIGIFAGSPVRDLTRDPVRSSIGRLSRRADIAAVAIVIVSAAFASAAAMVAPVSGILDHFRSLVASQAVDLAANFFLDALCPALLGLFLVVAVWAGRRNIDGHTPRREHFCRFALALLPLGLGMWAAHLLFHLATGWATLDPVLHQAALDFSVHGLARPQWQSAPPLLSANALLGLQLAVLDAGLLLSLYAGRRIARQLVLETRQAIVVIVPWAAIPIALYAAGVWILLQPMQMRGMVHG
jgi:cytochrome c oxidase assembly factor CtaG/ferredoxin